MVMDSLMADAFGAFAMAPAARTRNVRPRLDEKEDGTAYALTLSAPGVKPHDLKVSVTNGVLEVVGETKTRSATHSLRWSTLVPRDADADAITCAVQDGIVSLELPKKAEAAPLKISVTSDAAPEANDSDDEKTYTLTYAVPGLAAADVDLSAADGVLQFKGETKRTGARIAKRVRLPRDADVAGASACHVDGLLTLTLPKKR